MPARQPANVKTISSDIAGNKNRTPPQHFAAALAVTRATRRAKAKQVDHEPWSPENQ